MVPDKQTRRQSRRHNSRKRQGATMTLITAKDKKLAKREYDFWVKAYNNSPPKEASFTEFCKCCDHCRNANLKPVRSDKKDNYKILRYFLYCTKFKCAVERKYVCGYFKYEVNET
jgi:hypothetical protein